MNMSINRRMYILMWICLWAILISCMIAWLDILWLRQLALILIFPLVLVAIIWDHQHPGWGRSS